MSFVLFYHLVIGVIILIAFYLYGAKIKADADLLRSRMVQIAEHLESVAKNAKGKVATDIKSAIEWLRIKL